MQIETIVQSGHYLHISDIAFSPDGNTIATCSPDESVRLWDIAMGCETAVLKGHRGPVYCVDFNPDGSLLASCSWDLTVRLWDPVSRTCKLVLDSTDQKGMLSIDNICFSSSGRMIASAGNNRFNEPNLVTIWDTESGKKLKSHEVPDRIWALVFSPDEKYIAIGADAGLRVLQVDTGATVFYIQEQVTLEDNASEGNRYTGGLAFTEDSKLLLVAGAGKVHVMDIENNTKLSPLPLADIFKIQRVGDGSHVAFGKDSVTIWDVSQQRVLEYINTRASALSANGQLLARAEGRVLELIDRHSAQVIRRLGSQLQLPDQIGNLHRQFVLCANPVYPILASAAPDGLVRLWDLTKAGAPHTFQGHNQFIEAMAFDPKGAVLATGGNDQTVKLWQAKDGQLVHTITVDSSVWSLTFSLAGTMLYAGLYNGAVALIDTLSGKLKGYTPPLHKYKIAGLAAPLGDQILTASQNHICVWNHQFNKIASVDLGIEIHALAHNPEGVLAIGVGHTKWFGMADAKMIQGIVSLFVPGVGFTHYLTGHSAPVLSVAFSPDGKIVTSGGADGRILSWEVSSGKNLLSIDAHAGDVTGVCFTSDGSFIVSIGLDTVVRLWETATGKLVATLVSLNDQDYVSITDEGYYSATKAALRSVMFRSDGEIFPFDQFDLQLNRPDKYLQRLDFALPQLIDAYAEAHERRMKHLGFSSNGSANIDHKPPRIKIMSAPPIGVSPSREVQLTIAIESQSADLDRLLVYCNDVPLHGQSGLDIQSLGLKGEMSVSIQLMTGDNKVQLCAVNKNGIESAKASFRTVFAGDQAKPKLYLLCVGVSNYADSKFNLDYASKDAQDLVKVIDKLQHRFSEVNNRILTDGAASRSAILQSRAFLEQTSIDDHVVILFAGHGTIRNLDYYFLPSDFNIDKIETTGITYDEIQSLLDGIPARRRLVLLDTCHAGEMEEFDTVPMNVPLGKGVKARALREIQFTNGTKQKRKQGRIPILERLPELFADLRRDSGANVIAAAAAMEYARELNKISNGVFTSCVIDALRNAKADKNKDGSLTVSELHRFVTRNVIELTAGHQRPISRRENITDDFPVI